MGTNDLSNNIMNNFFSAKTYNLIKNGFFLYGITAAKLILPLITLPYLTRVLTTEAYGVTVYVKACMVYVQLIIDFGFGYSVTKEIVGIVKGDGSFSKKHLGQIAGDTLVAKLFLVLLSATLIFILSVSIPILRNNLAFTWLYFIGTSLSIFVLDFMFRGIERMGIITISFCSSKVLSTLLTLAFVKCDADLLAIPILEITGNTTAAALSMFAAKRLGVRLSVSGAKAWVAKIRESAVYFLSDVATTAFGALNTLFIGIFLPFSQIATWSVSLQLVSAVQQMYSPIFGSLYPYMVREKSIKVIRNVMLIFMPIILVGCLFCFVCAKWIIFIVSGPQYIDAIPVFRSLIPLMFVSFPGMLFGWPTLGAIGRAKETTLTTIITAVAQVIGLVALSFSGYFTIKAIAILRIATETLMLLLRGSFCIKYRKEFA